MIHCRCSQGSRSSLWHPGSIRWLYCLSNKHVSSPSTERSAAPEAASWLTVSDAHRQNQSEAFYKALHCSGFIPLLCQGVQRGAGIFLWNTSLLVSEVHRDSKVWCTGAGLSSQEACLLSHLLHYLRSYYMSIVPPSLSTPAGLTRGGVAFLPHWLWAWSGDLIWPMEGGYARVLVKNWGSKGPSCSLPFCFCQHLTKNLPLLLLEPPDKTRVTWLLANLYTCEEEMNFCCCKPLNFVVVWY